MITTIVLKILLIIILVIVILLHFSVTVFVRGGTGGNFEIKLRYLGITLYPRPKKKKKKKKKKRRKKKKAVKPKQEISETNTEEMTETVAEVAEEKPDETADTQSAAEEIHSATVEEVFGEETSSIEDEKPEDKPAGKKGRKSRKKKEKKKKEKKPREKKEKPEKGESKLDGLKRKWEFIKPYIPPAWKYSKKLLKAVRIEDVKINIDTGKEDAAESAQFYGKLQAALFSVLNFLAMIFTLRVKEANINCHFNVKRLDAEGEAVVKVRPSTMIAIAFCLLFCCAKIFIPYKFRQWREKRRKKKSAEKIQNATVEN
ncbi:hypothetical protein [Ruminococcus albus]|uniref:Conserved domain protein n=1 Tax=Ruminococcus albus 8 TaxID=246199 RepID=E9SBE3_RUMAL|nr:hypothetical protein [Ruminococcus albus]EGC03444.1 conserved domain protein [Ruminococcus albus 8]MCC3350284.1 hypothetical protein [Ruminococcus albus 8]